MTDDDLREQIPNHILQTHLQEKLEPYKYFFLLSYSFQHNTNFSDVLQVVLKAFSKYFFTQEICLAVFRITAF